VDHGGGTGEQFIVSPGAVQDAPGVPSLGFGDGDTGFYEGVDDLFRVAIGGVAQWAWSGATFIGNTGGSAAIRNVVASATVPSVHPASNDLDTGLGHSAADQLSIVAGGVEIARAVESPGANQLIIAPGVTQNAPTTPSLAFGDGNTGFFESADNTLVIATGNAARWQIAANNFLAINAAGPFMFNTAGTSGTTPIMGPNRGDNNTGIGHVADDNLSLIAGGLEGVRIEDPADLAATETSLWLFDDDNAAIQQVTVGIADSGGAGFKVLRIVN